jgi:hypothetical protein
MTTLIDFILDLFRSPGAAASYVMDPEGALRDAGLPNVSAAQLASVAATAAPAGVMLGGGDPVVGLQRAVADYHSFAASPFSPQTAFTSAPAFAPDTDFASNNSTDFASHNDTSFMSPRQDAGANAQQGAFNLGFGDITLGDKTSTTNTATNGGVVSNGDSHGPIVTGDGAVLGHGNTVNNGDVWAGSGSHVAVGEGNEIQDSSQHASGHGQVISGNDGPVISGNDMSGGHGGGASASGSGGGLLNIGGSGGHANGGDGGNAGSIIVTNSDTHAVGGDQTSVGGDYGSHNSSSVDTSTHTTTSTDSSVHSDSSTHIDSSAQTDSSVHSSPTEDSVHSSGGLSSGFSSGFSSNVGPGHADTSVDAESHAGGHTDFHGF